MRDSQAAPIRVWAYTAAMLAGVLGMSLVLQQLPGERSGISTAPQHMNLQRLDAPAAGVRVVVLGSSKAYYALDYDGTFVQRLADRAPAVQFNRLTWLAADGADMQAVLERLARRPPDWLLIESDLVSLDRSGIRWRHRLGILETWLDGVFAAGSRDASARRNLSLNQGHDRFQTAQECVESQSAEMKLAYALRASNWKVSTAAQRQPYLTWLRRLRDAGTKVVLLEIPRAPWADDAISKGLSRSEAALLGSLAREERFERWRSEPLEPSAFCDEGHMSVLGRERFSGWLAARLGQSLPPAVALLSHDHAR